MSTDPVGHESCLGRAPTEDADRAQEPSPFAHAMTLSCPDTPVIAKTARLAVTMIPGGVSSAIRRTYHRRTAASNQNRAKSCLYLTREYDDRLTSSASNVMRTCFQQL